jgi:hypothetical protein
MLTGTYVQHTLSKSVIKSLSKSVIHSLSKSRIQAHRFSITQIAHTKIVLAHRYNLAQNSTPDTE